MLVHPSAIDLSRASLSFLAERVAAHRRAIRSRWRKLPAGRQALVRLLTDGEIPYALRGRHRRVLLRDVLDYQERTRRDRRQALDQLAAEGEDTGLYDLTASPRPTR